MSAQAPASKRGWVRGLVVLVMIVGWLAIAAIGGQKIGGLASQQTNDQAAFLPSSAESVRAATAAVPFQTDRSLPGLLTVVVEVNADPAKLQAWQQFSTTIATLPVTLEDGTSATVGQFLIAGAPIPVVPADDGQAVLLVVPFASDPITAADAGKPALQAVVDAVRQAATNVGAGAAYLTGPAGLIADLGEAFAGIDGLLLLVALGVVLAILLLVYRAIALPVLVLFSTVSCLALAGWIVGALAGAEVLTLNGQSQGILFILVIGAATDYGLLLTARYREELTRNDSPFDAMKVAWRAVLEPIAASAGTVIIGLLCLLLSDLNSTSSLGPVGAIGIGAALIGSLTLLPALLVTGRWVFWPRIPRLRAEPLDSQAGHETQSGMWHRLAATIRRRPRRIWMVTGVVLLAMCAALPTFRASGVQQSEVFLGEPNSVVGQQLLEKHFPGGIGSPVVIVAPDVGREQVIAALASVDGIAGPPTPMTTSGAPTGPARVIDGRVVLQATLTAGVDTDEAKATVLAVRNAVHALGFGDQVLVGGATALQLDTVTASDRDLRVIVPAILLAVLLVLILLLRSLVAPVLLMLATVLSFGSALGVSALLFNHVLDFPGADPSVPLYGFVFLVALGVDYSIFLMSRAREESLRRGPIEGVLSALVSTGGVITSAGVVLAATFAALAVIPILFLVQIAFIVSFGVLLDTLVVRSLLVSALSVDVGRRTWWPSRLGRSDFQPTAAVKE